MFLLSSCKKMASIRITTRRLQGSNSRDKVSQVCQSCIKKALRTSRRYSSDATVPPLSVALPGVTEARRDLGHDHEKGRPKVGQLQVTTLSNGIKVASEDSFGPFCTLGVLVDAGSRHEVDYPSGITHMLEKMAFQSTRKFSDSEEINERMEKLGGNADCQSFRDCTIYAASALKSNVSGALEVLSEAVWNPQMKEDEIEEQKKTISFEVDSLEYRPEPEPQLHDMIHAAGYSGNTLGLPKICPLENLTVMDAGILTHFMKRYYTPQRMTIAAMNANHEELVRWAEEYFTKDSPFWINDMENIPPVDESIAQYTGGMIRDHRSEPRAQPGPNPLPELAHVSIGFESASYNETDFFAFAVLNMLLGGGGSFSAGGPGKGMYSRLYLNVLNRHHWMYTATAYNHSYADSGIFCINASSHPSQVKDLTQVVIREFVNLATGLPHKEEMSRAKKQLQSMLMMNLESRVIAFEDIGRQVLGLGYRKSPQELYDSIEAVTAEDIKNISEKMLMKKPCIAAIGELSRLPNYEDIERAIMSRGALKSSGRFFFNRF